MKYLKYLLIVLTLSFFSCKEKKLINIGTFNIQWLGDGIEDNITRADTDYARIAGIIDNSEADIICLQEIENSGSLELLTNHLNGFQYYITNYGEKQNLGVLYKNDLNLDNFKIYDKLKINDDTRPGLVFDYHYNNSIITFLVVHLKSTSRYDSTVELKNLSYKYRAAQSIIIERFIDSLSSINKNFIITGDFNDNPLKSNSQIINLHQNKNITFLTSGFKSVKNPMWMNIDHIIISNSLLENYLNGSNRIYNFGNSILEKYLNKISDHYPVIATFQF